MFILMYAYDANYGQNVGMQQILSIMWVGLAALQQIIGGAYAHRGSFLISSSLQVEEVT
jgi:hypothetical protein